MTAEQFESLRLAGANTVKTPDIANSEVSVQHFYTASREYSLPCGSAHW